MGRKIGSKNKPKVAYFRKVDEFEGKNVCINCVNCMATLKVDNPWKCGLTKEIVLAKDTCKKYRKKLPFLNDGWGK